MEIGRTLDVVTRKAWRKDATRHRRLARAVQLLAAGRKHPLGRVTD